MKLDTRNALLQQHGYRSTPQRYLILRVIQKAQEHLNVEQIALRVQETNPCVSLSTVYRTLELLQELELVRASHFPGQHTCYESVEGKAHLHLVCRGCQATLHLDQTLLGTLHECLEEQYHFHGLTLDLLAAGYCDACWKTLSQDTGSQEEGSN
ncbi:MAG: Fur family transcriptional regulator [Ktedonobacteraceae bacterium]